jgi:ubiquitin carboxyl-terminal hydrolase L3
MIEQRYRKHFTALESNPDVFSQLIHRLGVFPRLTFQDIVSLDDPDSLSYPAHALILIFLISNAYKDYKIKEEVILLKY